VLTIRIAACVTFTASVCARIIASPRRMSTSDGGITTPSVLATHTSAAPRSRGAPLASSLGWTVRPSISALAPTEPFIGASNAARARPASGAAAPVGRSALDRTRNSVPASGR